MYDDRLRGLDWVRPPAVRPHVRMSWCLYVVTLAEGINRDLVMQAMQAEGVPTRGYFSPVHLQPYIREQWVCKEGDLPVTESMGQRCVALPFFNGLMEVQVDRVVAALTQAVARCA